MPAGASMSKKKITWIFVASILGGLVLALLFWLWLEKNPQIGKVSSSDLALALLSEDDIATAADAKGRVRAQLIELNDHMEPEAGGAVYKTFVARLAVDRVTGAPFATNAVLLYDTAEQAKNFMTTKASGNDALTLGTTYADESLAYYSAESDSEPASVTVRLVDGAIGGKVQVFDMDSSVTSAEQAKSKLLPVAEKMAKKQASKISDLLLGTTRFSNEASNRAMAKLPESVAGATAIGQAKVKDTEWLAITGDLTSDSMPGFASGALARFQVTARPNEAIEVTVLEFDSADRAKEYYSKFLTEGVAVDESIGAQQMTLPSDLADEAAGLLQETLVEIQSAQGKFLVDVSIISPYTTIEKDAAVADVTEIARTILGSFTE